MTRTSVWYLAGCVIIGAAPLIGCGGSEQSEPADNGPAAASQPSGAKAATAGSKKGVPAQTAEEKNLYPMVVVHTNLGDLTIKLNAEKAPLTVDNFLQYVDAGHYDGTIFHQVVGDYIALGGGYTPELEAKPARPPIRNEADNGLTNRRGSVAMARRLDAIDSSTCQFFINLNDNGNLDHHGRDADNYGFCVFGEVVNGMEVLDQLAKVPVENKTKEGEPFEMVPAQTVVIKSAARIR